MTLISSILSSELQGIIYDAGALFVNGTRISVSRGGVQCDPNEEWESYEFPGKAAPVQLCDELVSCAPVIKVTLLVSGESQISTYRPGGEWGDHADINDARTFTPDEMRVAAGSGLYLTDVIAVWPRQRGDYFALHFPVGFCKSYAWSSADDSETGFEVEIEARIPTGESINTVPYLLHTYPAGTEAVG